jgi:osmoprotectant transport system permease protein
VGGGTLGAFIVQGIEVRALDRVVGAAILVALLAIFTELAFGLLQRRAVSPGLRAQATRGPSDATEIPLPAAN